MSRISGVGGGGGGGGGSEKFSAGLRGLVKNPTLYCRFTQYADSIESVFLCVFSLLLITSKQMELTLSPTKIAVLNFCHLKQ